MFTVTVAEENGEEPDNARATGGDTPSGAGSGGGQQTADSVAHLVNNNEIGLVIRTRSQKAADGQFEELTSVETMPVSIVAESDLNVHVAP